MPTPPRVPGLDSDGPRRPAPRPPRQLRASAAASSFASSSPRAPGPPPGASRRRGPSGTRTGAGTTRPLPTCSCRRPQGCRVATRWCSSATRRGRGRAPRRTTTRSTCRQSAGCSSWTSGTWSRRFCAHSVGGDWGGADEGGRVGRFHGGRDTWVEPVDQP